LIPCIEKITGSVEPCNTRAKDSKRESKPHNKKSYDVMTPKSTTFMQSNIALTDGLADGSFTQQAFSTFQNQSDIGSLSPSCAGRSGFIPSEISRMTTTSIKP
jgi:hypothetical protein